MVSLESVTSHPGQGWSSLFDESMRNTLGEAGIPLIPTPIALQADLPSLEDHIGLHIGMCDEVVTLKDGFDALRRLRELKALPPSIHLVVSGPIDTPLPMVNSSPQHDPAFVQPIPADILGSRTIVRDIMNVVWFATNARREHFRIERHISAIPTPPDDRPLHETPIEIRDMLALPLSSRLSVISRNEILPSPLDMKKFLDGSITLLWSNAQVTAVRDVIVYKRLTLRRYPQQSRSAS